MTVSGQVVFAQDASSSRSIDPRADRVLRQMSDYLGSLTEFMFRAENTADEYAVAGSKVQFGQTVDVYVKRPDRLKANVQGDLENQQFFFDGKSITLFNKDKNVYTTLKAPGEIEQALEHAQDAFGIDAPLGDLIYRDAYRTLMKEALFGHYIGLHLVQGVQCHHLLFVQDDIDWQIWIENSPTPLPRKMVITSKWLAGGPQFTALIDYWKTSTSLAEDLFIFTAPVTARQIELLPAGTGTRDKK
jgi:hypothetical protein